MKQKNLMLISTSEWASPWLFRRHHFAMHFARQGWRVLYVNPQKSVVQVLKEQGITGPFKKRNKAYLSEHPLIKNLFILRPQLATPCFVKRMIGTVISKWFLKRHLKKNVARVFGKESYIQLIYNPCDIRVVDRMNPIIYDIVDKFDAYPELKNIISFIREQHECSASAAECIISTSTTLVPNQWIKKSHIIPNGVDCRLFREGSKQQCPSDLDSIPCPRAIYAGAIMGWFDHNLLRETARLLPHVHFVIIGFPHFENDGTIKNIHYLGKKDQTMLPAYYGHCQVGIIPFKRNELTKHVNPLKLYEYLAAGIPCVSTPMDPIIGLASKGVLAIAEESVTFAQMIENQIAGASHPKANDKRIEIANNHDWLRLAEKFHSIASEI